VLVVSGYGYGYEMEVGYGYEMGCEMEVGYGYGGVAYWALSRAAVRLRMLLASTSTSELPAGHALLS
jgi:hypothetical protein